MAAPEVVPVNSSTVRVLWSPPLRPNGAVTAYNIYVDDQLRGGVDNSSGSYLVVDLLSFTVYSVQVNTQTNTCIYGMKVCALRYSMFFALGGGVYDLCMCQE